VTIPGEIKARWVGSVFLPPDILDLIGREGQNRKVILAFDFKLKEYKCAWQHIVHVRIMSTLQKRTQIESDSQ
jgi:hypothetical protein